jgi:bile acid:Na+ symporter, BASS family
MATMSSLERRSPGVGWVDRLNGLHRSHFVTILLSAVVMGAVWPSAGVWLKDWAFFRVPGTGWLYDFPNLSLGLMMLSASLQVDLRDFRQLQQRPRAGMVGLFVVYLFLPAVTATVGLVWANASGQERGLELLLGLMLSTLMPVAMTSCVWIRQCGGNLALLLALIAMTTATAVATVPLSLTGLIGFAEAKLSVPTGSIVQQLVVSVTLPLVCGVALRRWLGGRARFGAIQSMSTLLGHVALWLIVVANVGVALPHVLADSTAFFTVVGLTVLLNLFAYATGLVFARVLDLSQEDALTLIFASGMRSNSTGLMLGLKTFPGMPLVAVPAAIYMVSQHLIAAVLSRALERSSSAWLGRVIASEPKSLEGYLGRALEQRTESSPGLGLLVFQSAHPWSQRRQREEWAALLRSIRRSVRMNDFVCELGPQAFGVVLVASHPKGCELVRTRLESMARSLSPSAALSCGLVHAAGKVLSPSRLIFEATFGTQETTSPGTHGWAISRPNPRAVRTGGARS